MSQKECSFTTFSIKQFQGNQPVKEDTAVPHKRDPSVMVESVWWGGGGKRIHQSEKPSFIPPISKCAYC